MDNVVFGETLHLIIEFFFNLYYFQLILDIYRKTFLNLILHKLICLMFTFELLLSIVYSLFMCYNNTNLMQATYIARKTWPTLRRTAHVLSNKFDTRPSKDNNAVITWNKTSTFITWANCLWNSSCIWSRLLGSDIH